jgi:predicted methyltransferase
MKSKILISGLAICLGIILASGAHAADDGFAAGLASEGRPAADRDRDATRKPDQVIEFLGVESGMTVMDVIAVSGYYTEVLSAAVGPDGTVIAQNPPGLAQRRGGQAAIDIMARADRLGNVETLFADLFPVAAPPGTGVAMAMGGAMMAPGAMAGQGPQIEIGDMSDHAGTIDVAITALNLHDINNRGAEGGQAFVEAIYEVLKPGAVFGVIDHVGIAGQDNAQFHRIQREQVAELLTSAGFEIEAESDILANPEDDHTLGIRDESVSGKTDRMLFKARKPG